MGVRGYVNASPHTIEAEKVKCPRTRPYFTLSTPLNFRSLWKILVGFGNNFRKLQLEQLQFLRTIFKRKDLIKENVKYHEY